MRLQQVCHGKKNISGSNFTLTSLWVSVYNHMIDYFIVIHIIMISKDTCVIKLAQGIKLIIEIRVG